MKLKLCAVLLCMLASLSAGAQLFSPKVTQTIGAGANISYFVVNFDDAPGFKNDPASDYVFGYKWDFGPGTVAPTGDDMLHALIAPGTGVGLQAVEGNFPGFGNFVSSLTFGSHSQTGDFALNQSFWSYWLTTGERLGLNPTDWSSSSVGIGGRALANNSYDGWNFSAFGSNFAPSAPSTPEPSACLLFAMGSGSMFVLGRKHARKNGRNARRKPTLG
ncbi:MAG: hypothetical protein JWN14_5081 [Chthonomonadales bacterium]|nr:hypothetical protein [Chthonomonadales bacterium]